MLWNTWLMALGEIRRNALRSALTMLGMVIGVGSVILLVSIGQGATAQVTSEIASMGDNLLIVHPGSDRRRGGPSASASPFDETDVKAITKVVGVASAAPSSQTAKTVVFGNVNWPTSITGTTNDYLKIRNYEIGTGRMFTKAEQATARPVCVLGKTVVDELFDDLDLLEQSIRIGKVSCRVIGTLKSKGQSSGGMDQDDLILMPLAAFQRRIAGNTDIGAIFLAADKKHGTTKTQEGIQTLLRERRHIGATDSDDFTVRDMQEIAQIVTSATSTLTLLLGAIAAVSLLVGGIGIMNIMLVSVTERIREIGIRIAVGALPSEVQAQFLVESVTLSILGGLIGVVFGVIGAWATSKGLSMPFVILPETIGLAFAVSAVIGVVFGYLPARKAAALEPIEALRHE